MGNPAKASSPLPRPADDALSLHSQPERHYLDGDAPDLHDDDLPPPYDEQDESSSAPLLPGDAPAAGPGLAPSSLSSFAQDANTGAEHYLDPRLDTDPKFLESHIRRWAATPPRVFVSVYGSHRQQVESHGKKETKNVTDFHVKVELTPFLYADATRRTAWTKLRTVGNSEKARRGTVLEERAPGFRRGIELGTAEEPTLAEWCHRYCANHAGLKAFTLRRRVTGFQSEILKEKLQALVERTNYRGHVKIQFPVQNAIVEVYNDCRTNRWRLTSWIVWFCYLTLVFLLTWPYLWLRTKRYEVVTSDWHFSKLREDGSRAFVSVSEDQWYNMWGRAIHKAVLEKRQTTLDQQDLIAAQTLDPVFDTGNPAVDGAMGVLRAGVNAMNEVSRQLGWGWDTA